ncbi:hypothetical protein [Pseudomonas tohonis]|uniref:hypothetical protein n=1 Tax=Pseudomonas tohonis TaxID=2725477 RepID=UPI0022F13C71|nr:hypothetical protein [Pseudomonas tohonis]
MSASRCSALVALRTFCYLMFGVLTALPLALLSLLLPWQGHLLSAFLLLGAWAGTAGLVRALVIEPARASLRGNLITCALLLIGMRTLLFGLLLDPGQESLRQGDPDPTFDLRMLGLLAIFYGPILVALHYLARVASAFYRNADCQGLRLLAGLAFLIVLLPQLLKLAWPTLLPVIMQATGLSTLLPTGD